MKKEIELDGSRIYSLEDFHREIALLLGFPHYYDNTLDSLWICLSTYIDPNIKLNWTNHSSTQKYLGYDFERIISIFNDMQDEDERFEFYLN